MRRLLASMRLDATLQARNKLFHIGLGVAVLTGALARAFVPPHLLPQLLPGLYLGAIGGTTYMFGAGMMLFEKSQRTIEALSISPLRVSEYIASKTLTLTAFAMVESLIVLAVANGLEVVNLTALFAGIALLGVQYTLFAMAQVVTKDSVAEFMIPVAVVTMTLLQLPIVDAFGIASPRWLYLLPTEAPVVLMKAGCGAVEPWQLIYAVSYGSLSVLVLLWFARRRLLRHAFRRVG